MVPRTYLNFVRAVDFDGRVSAETSGDNVVNEAFIFYVTDALQKYLCVCPFRDFQPSLIFVGESIV
jgi:hypothetical protein